MVQLWPELAADYLAAVAEPCDLGTVRERLATYAALGDFVRDVRLVFANSRAYNTRARGPIHRITDACEAFFVREFVRHLPADALFADPGERPARWLAPTQDDDGNGDERATSPAVTAAEPDATPAVAVSDQISERMDFVLEQAQADPTEADPMDLFLATWGSAIVYSTPAQKAARRHARQRQLDEWRRRECRVQRAERSKRRRAPDDNDAADGEAARSSKRVRFAETLRLGDL